MMKRILLVSYWFPPAVSAEAILCGKVARALARRGADVTVVCAPHAPGAATDHAFADVVSGESRVIRTRAPRFPESAARVLRKVAPGMLALPDEQFAWRLPAAAAVRRVAEEWRPDVVYSRGQPFTGHLAVLAARRSIAAPWVAHFSDPWTGNPLVRRGRIARRANLAMERRVLEAADAAVYVCRENHDLAATKPRGVATVIPHCFDPALYEDAGSDGRADRVLRVVHLGSLYGARSPEPVLRALASLPEESADVHVRFVGPWRGAHERLALRLGLGERVSFEPRVSYLESLRLAAGADVPLVIDAPGSASAVFAPSKVYDYLPLLKPILGVTEHESPTGRLLSGLGCPVVRPGDVDEIARTLGAMAATRAADGALRSPYGRADIAAYDVGATTESLLTLFAEVARGDEVA